MRLKQMDVFLLKMLFLLAAGIIVFQTLGRSSMTSMLFYMTFPVTLLLWLRTVRKTITGMDILTVLTIVLAIICVLADAGLNNASLNFAYVRKLIIFSMTLLYLQTAYRLQIDPKTVSFINKVIDLLTVYLILVYIFQTGKMYTLSGRVTNYLTFRIGNPNLTGLYLTCFYMLELYRIFTPERWYWKCIHVAMAGLLVAFVLLTQSRNSLMVVMLFTAITAWLIFRGKKNLHISKLEATVTAVFPILFLVAYVLLVEASWIQELFAFMVSEGKYLNSRMSIWGQALQHLWNSPVIGSYHDISGGAGMSQMHNSHLDVAASYGLPVLSLLCVLLRNYLYQRGRHYDNKQSFIYILGFACAIVLGTGEAALFSGGLGIYIFVGAFLLLADREEPTENVG